MSTKGEALRIYAMSDIHGNLEPLAHAVSTINLDNPSTRLVLLGDYCDRGPDSLGVFQYIMDLQNRYGDRVIALRGNHEEMFLEYIDEADDPNFARGWMLADSNMATTKSLLGPEDFKHAKHLVSLRKFEDAYAFVVESITSRHADIVAWVRALPYYYESPFKQVFVHAGIDEEAGDLWKIGTPQEWFTEMPPEYAGQKFYLDVISGHITTETVSAIPNYRGIWHDGASHYYIDGNVTKYGELAILEYDSATGAYTGPGLG